MERVTEHLHTMEKEFHAANLYTATGNFTEFVFTLGDVKEEENIYRTDGPEKTTKARFILTEKLDKNASLKVIFTVNGESLLDNPDTVKIAVEGKLDITFSHDFGPGYETFISFYLSHMRPRVKDMADHSLDEIIEKIMNFLSKEFTVKEV
jgi:hypothetical protein